MYSVPVGSRNPDFYVLVKADDDIRVLGGYYGGYLDGDSWTFSTPIKKVLATNERGWIVETLSGSVYTLSSNLEHAYHLNGLTEAVYTRFKDDADAKNQPFSVVPPTEVSTILEGLF